MFWYDGLPLFVEQSEEDLFVIMQDLGQLKYFQQCDELLVHENQHENEASTHEVF